MHRNLFHALIEDAHAPAIPARPDFATNEFWGRFVKGPFYFHITVPMNIAPSFLKAGKQRLRQWLEVRPLLFKTGSHLLTCRAMGFMLHFCPGSDRPDEFQDCGGSGSEAAPSPRPT
jgi:hypothetical protein